MKYMSWGLGMVVIFLAPAVFPQLSARAVTDTMPPTGTIVINSNRSATNNPEVTLALTWDDGVGGSGVTRMRFSDNGSNWTGWEPPASARVHTLPGPDGHKTVRVQFLDRANNYSKVYSDYILLDTTPPTGGILINNGDATTTGAAVTLALHWDDGACGAGVTRMRFSDNGSTWTAWAFPASARPYTLPLPNGNHTVRVQYLDGAGNYSAVYNDYIKLQMYMDMVSVTAGKFPMGRTGEGADVYGRTDEDPQHEVTLSAYKIGRYEVTNRQYCDVLNWALAQGFLKTVANEAWAGSGDLYADADGSGAGTDTVLIAALTQPGCNIQYSRTGFCPKTRTGLPDGTVYSMAMHPMVTVSWWGCAAFCNWLSQMQGLSPCYDMTKADWPLKTAPPTAGGYRLPTEAEWECAAAWDGEKHWTFPITSDTLSGKGRANYYDSEPDFANPLGLTTMPYTSPVGWFNGVNSSPNGNVTTVNSASPVGCYDMAGNAWEWCGDWYLDVYYSGGAMTNPTGPDTGTERAHRGGSWGHGGGGGDGDRCAGRGYFEPSGTSDGIGFRVVR